MDELSRRVYLLTVTGSMTAVAGCNGEDEESNTTTTNVSNSTQQASTEPSLDVTTGAPTNVEYDSATLHGSFDGTTDPSAVETAFEYRPVGGEWTRVDASDTAEFDTTIDGLDAETEYEFRAVITGTKRVTGLSKQFTTEPNVITYDGGGTTAFQEAIDAAAERPGATIQFEKGQYRFEPTRSYDVDNPPGPHAKVGGLENVTIDGNGATITLAEPRMGGILFVDGASLTVRDLTIDYDPLPFTQGQIESFSPSDRTLVIELDDEYPSLTADRFGQGEVFASLHDQDGSFIDATRAGGLPIKRFQTMEQIDDRRWRLTLTNPSTNNGLEAGKRIAITARDPPGLARPLTFLNIETPRVENVAVHASPSFALLFANCQSPHAEGVEVRPPADSDRLIGSDADGIHVLNSRGGPTIVDCHIERLLDDGIIVSSLMAPVDRVEGNTVHVDPVGVFAPQQSDTLEAMTAEGVRSDPLPSIASITPEYEASDGVSPAKAIEFESSVADRVTQGDYLANAASANSGFVVRNNTVRDNRANSIRISADSGEVVDNELLSSQNQTINVLCDTSGRYAPERWTNDVVIKNNSIRASGKSYLGGNGPAGVFIGHTPAEGIETEGTPNRNIDIVGNSFESLGFRVGDLHDARAITVEENEVAGVNELDYPEGREAFFIGNVDGATFTGNAVAAVSDYVDSFGRRHESDRVELANNTFRLDGGSESVSFR